MSKTLIIADIHLKTKDQFDLTNNIVSDRSIYKLKRLRELVEKEKPDILIDAGDFYDSKMPSEPLRYAFFKVLDSFDIPVYLISGNHSQEHGFTAGTSESFLADKITVVQPREVLVLGDDFTLIGYCRDKEEFLKLCQENPNKYLVTHGDIPSENLPFEKCFFGHVHQHYSIGKKYSIGALFTDSFGEESYACMYCTIGATVDFKEFPDQSIRTFNELTEFEDGEYLAVRYKLKGKAKDFLGIDQEAIKRSYKKTKVFFDIELTEEELVFDDSLSIEEIAQDFIENKGLSDKELKFGKLILQESGYDN